MFQLIGILVMTVIAADRFAGAPVLCQDHPGRLQLGNGSLKRLIVGAVQRLKINLMAHGQRQIDPDDALFIPFRRIGRQCLPVVGGCLIIISLPVLNISHVVGHDIVLAEAERQQRDLRESGIVLLLIITQERGIHDAPGNHKETCGRNHTADGAQDPAEGGFFLFGVIVRGITRTGIIHIRFTIQDFWTRIPGDSISEKHSR